MTLKHLKMFVWIGLVLAGLSATSTHAAPVGRGKPPKNPTATPTPGSGGCQNNGGGTIYYADAGSIVHALDADCGTDLALPDVPGDSLRPSKHRHDGKRWFLKTSKVQGLPTYPDGRSARELWAHDETGASVQLTDYTAGGTVLNEVWITDGGLQWAPDDSFISWVAARWNDDDLDGTFDRLDGAGVYRADVIFDASGNVAGLADPRPATPVVLIDTAPAGLPVYRHAWSPDAGQLIYGKNNGLRRVDDIPNSDPSTHVFVTEGDVPDWSVSGKVVYHYVANYIYSINSDGSGRDQLVSDRKKTIGFPWWSPTGSHVVYLSAPCCPFDTYRVTAGGSGKVKLIDGETIGWVTEE